MNPLRTLSAAAAFISCIAIAGAAHAAGAAVTWKTVDDALATARNEAKPAVVVIREGGAQALADDPDLAKAFGDRNIVRLASKGDAFFAIATQAAAGKLLTLDASAVVVVTDLEGAPVERFEEAPGPNALLKAIKRAASISKKKERVIKKVAKAFDKAEELLAAESYKAATELYSFIAALEGQLADERVARSIARLSEIGQKAQEQLSEADDLIRQKQYAQAQKILVRVRNEFPTPEVAEQVQERQNRIAREIDRANR